MKKAKVISAKRSFFMSVLSLILCFTMLLGTTYAWFTDSVESGKNQIIAGNLDVELYHSNTGVPTKADSEKVTGATDLFHVDLWEPGVIAYENFTVANVGNLAFKYNLSLTDWNYNTVTVDNVKHDLSEVIKIATVAPGTFNFSGTPAEQRAQAHALFAGDNDYSFKTYQETGVLYPVGNGSPSESSFGVILYWEPTDNDNIYNINNGKHVSDGYKINGEEALWLDIGINLVAMQKDYEVDSFDEKYDIQPDELILPDWSGESNEVAVTETEGAKLEVKVADETRATAKVEAKTKINGEFLNENEKLKLTVKPDDTPNGIKVEAGNSVTTYDVSLIKVVTTEATDTSGETKTDVKVTEADKPVLVSLNIGVVDLQEFYHHGEKLTPVNSIESVDVDKYYYDQMNSTVYFKTKSFSPFASVYKYAGGLGTEDYPYLIANGEQWAALGRTYDFGDGSYCIWSEEDLYINLINDIDLLGAELPECVGIYSLYLDGCGHTIRNCTAASLFGSDSPYWYYENEVKNLNIENCTTEGPLFGYGTYYESYDAKVSFSKVNAQHCNCGNNGSVFSYCGKGTVIMKDCLFSDVNVRGSSYGCGGFIGNISGGTIEIDSCKFGGTVVSDVGQVAGFVGQPQNFSDAAIKIANSEITEGTIIRCVGNGSVAAFDGHNGSVNYAAKNNICKAKLQSTGTKYAQGSEAVCESYTPVCSATDFVMNDDGSITYSGTATLGKILIEQQVTNKAYIYVESKTGEGGYHTNMQAMSAVNVKTGDVLTGLTKLKDIKMVITEGNTAIGGHTTTDAANVDQVVGDTYYFDARTYHSSTNGDWFYYLTSNSDGTNPMSDPITVTLRINVYEDTGAWGGSITGTTLNYTVPQD